MCIRDSNKNVRVIGGSGSGKTRFWLKPNLMQMHSSYVVTDPKGTILVAVSYTHLRTRRRSFAGWEAMRMPVDGTLIFDTEIDRSGIKKGSKLAKSDLETVSYTHLDVYKRQSMTCGSGTTASAKTRGWKCGRIR